MEAVKAGVKDYLVKPFHPLNILESIERIKDK